MQFASFCSALRGPAQHLTPREDSVAQARPQFIKRLVTQPPSGIAKNQRPVVPRKLEYGVIDNDESAAIACLPHMRPNLMDSLVIRQDRRNADNLVAHILGEPGLHFLECKLLPPARSDDDFGFGVCPENGLESRQKLEGLLDIWHPVQNAIEVEIDTHRERRQPPIR